MMCEICKRIGHIDLDNTVKHEECYDVLCCYIGSSVEKSVYVSKRLKGCFSVNEENVYMVEYGENTASMTIF